MDENYIRRERQRKEETKRTVAEMRAALKVCTMDDVRRHRMPFDKALLIGLEEKGYITSVKYIRQLIDLQAEMKEKAGPSSVIWTKPQLKDSKNLLTLLSDNLVKAEEQCKKKDHAKECEIFLNTATYVAFLNSDWWWLGEQLLLQSIHLSKSYPSLDGKYEALSRYAYAKFLYENIKEVNAALDNLAVVRELSKDKKWITLSTFMDTKDYLYTKTNYMLHICLMQKARSYMKIDVEKAIKVASIARKRAAEACYLDGETRALLLKGICEVTSKRASAAIATFTKAYYIQERIGNLEGVCATKLQLAQAYMINGDSLQSLKMLLSSRDCAERNNLTYFLAQAYKYLGEFYLNNGEPKKATPLLGESLKILHKTDNVLESEQVRNLEAISAGLELFPRYLKLLSDTGHPETGVENLMKMIAWKDSRKQFWSQEDESCEPSPQESDEHMNDYLSETSVGTSYYVENKTITETVHVDGNILLASSYAPSLAENFSNNEKQTLSADEEKH